MSSSSLALSAQGAEMLTLLKDRAEANDAELETRLDALWADVMRFVRANNAPLAMARFHEYVRLHATRSPQKVAAMEKERKLR